MLRTARTVLVLTLAAVLPLPVAGQAIAGGGFFPGRPSDFGFAFNPSSDFTATIVLDPNGPVSTGAPATLTGTFGTIAIKRNGGGVGVASFQVQPGSSLGELRFGCNLLDTNPRFVEFAPGEPGLPIGSPSFGNWLATDVTLKLFGQMGVTLVDQTNTIVLIPGITGVISQQCVAFPKGNPVPGTVPLSQVVNSLQIKPSLSGYPDLTIPGVTDQTQQWYPGFIVLEVGIGFWAKPGTLIP